MLGKEIRLKRLIPTPDGKYLGLTVDHAIARGVMPGLDTVAQTLRRMADGSPNAITMHKGIAENCFGPVAGTVSLVLKLTTFGIYHPNEDTPVADVEEAIALGADAVSVGCILGGAAQPSQLAMLGRFSKEAHRLGMPLISHIYPRGEMIPKADQTSVDNVIYAARAAAELGVDLIKTNYTGSPDTFAKVVQAVPARVAIAGGTSCKTAEEYIRMTRDVMDAGAAGVTYGRFVITYPHITALVKTLSQVIHNGMSVKEAMTLLSHLEHEEENCK